MQVQLTPINVAPTLILVIITIFNIIGNSIPAFTFSTTLYTSTAYLWRAETCSAAGLCVLTSHEDLGSGCSVQHHIRAAQAFGIGTSVFSGCLVVFALGQLLYQEKLGFKVISIWGVVYSTLLVGIELLEFILFASIKGNDCYSSVNPKFGPAPFMYLGGLVFALVLLFWNAVLMPKESSGAKPAGPTTHPQQHHINVVHHDDAHQPHSSTSVGNSEVSAASHHQQPLRGNHSAPPQPEPPAAIPSRGVPTHSLRFDHSHHHVTAPPPPPHHQSTTAAEPQNPMHSQLHLPNASTAAPAVSSAGDVHGEQEVIVRFEEAHELSIVPRLSAASTVENPVPEGTDWALDASSGLLWSDTQKLFFDPQSSQFYNPASELWYDPESNEWHQLS